MTAKDALLPNKIPFCPNGASSEEWHAYVNGLRRIGMEQGNERDPINKVIAWRVLWALDSFDRLSELLSRYSVERDPGIPDKDDVVKLRNLIDKMSKEIAGLQNAVTAFLVSVGVPSVTTSEVSLSDILSGAMDAASKGNKRTAIALFDSASEIIDGCRDQLRLGREIDTRDF